MKKLTKKDIQIQALQERIDHMESAYSKLLDYVSELASSREFNKDVIITRDPLNILDVGLTYIKRRLSFEALAFYLIEEQDASFYMARCEPESKCEKLLDEVNQFIEDGTFAWALRQNHAIIVPSKVPELKLVLHVLATQTRTRGMFVGVIKDDNLKINDLSVTMLSITVQNIAYALENVMLYQLLRKTSEMRLNSAVEKLSESEKRYQTLFEQSPDGILLMDTAGKILEFNETANRQLGYSRGEFEKLSLSDIDVVSSLEELQVKIGKFLEMGQSEFETKHRTKHGEVRDVNILTKVIVLSGRPVLHSIWHDISERKEAERKIKQSLQEKETLLREIHHRVKNNMAVVSSLLYLQAKKINDDAVRSLFEESQQRVKAMALVHEKLYHTENLSSINLKDYITSIVSEIVSLYRIDTAAITTDINVEDVELDLESAVPCGLIINELLTNAFKYAFPDNRKGILSVHLKKTDDTYTLTIKDDGVGLPEGFDYERSNTLGLQLVNVLTGQLDGSLQIKPDKGTEAVVTFKSKRE